jgi:predicted CXXCH cytochrome family protein
MSNVKGGNRKNMLNGTGRLIACTFALMAFLLISAVTVSAMPKLKSKIPALCYDCHKDLEKGLADRYVHFLFKQGKCITCHNSHVSKNKGLMIEDVDAVCLGCHEDINSLISKGSIHTALRNDDCTGCHYPHSGKNEYLLVEKEKDLCLKCHEDLSLKLNQQFACAPFKEGKCSACHDSHASEYGNLLTSSPVKLCKECHWPKCSAEQISISSLVTDIDCTTCHSGHSSAYKGLLGPYGHKVFLEKKCDECHDPIEAKKPVTTKLEGEQLCFNCHKRSKAKYQYVENDIHVKDAGNPCIVCHDYHASDNESLIRNERRLCVNCHEDTERRTLSMEKVLKSRICKPIEERKCFECHIPTHSDLPLNYRAEEIPLCARCHASQHKITHPLGNNVIDPRNGREVTCNSCHSMHSSQTEFMLTHDRKRALCIQCHKM